MPSEQRPTATSSSPPTPPSNMPNPRNKRKASALLASASKILKPSTAKSQKLPDHHSATPLPAFKKTKTPPSYIPVKRSAYVSPSARPPSTSPAEKPLPSLPVATVVGKSPIQRRSLIDATERPLRRSASLPPPGQVSGIAEEEWPALSPYRLALNQYDSRLAKPVKASVGESVIEAMRDLHIGNHDGKPSSLEPDKENVSAMIKVGSSSQSTCSALPRPTSGRKAKTPDRRLRQSTASSGDETSLKADGNTQPNNIPRSRSVLHHTATGRGSPYTVVTNSSNESLRHPRPPSPESTASLHTAKLVAVKEAKAIATAPDKRRTSIPIPTRLIRRLPNDDSEADAPNVKPCRASHASQEPSPSDADVDADVDTDHKSAKSASPPSAAVSQIKPPFKHPARTRTTTTSKMTFAELMTTPAPTEHELLHASPDPDLDPRHSSSDQGSLRGFDSDGGFKIKKIRARGRRGRPGTSAATLRISDSAQKLLGENSEQANRLPSSSTHLTKTSDIIRSKIQLPRSLTSRSIARLSSAATTDLTVNGDDGDNNTIIKHRQSQDSFAQSKQQPLLAINTNVVAAAAAADTPQNPIHRDWPLKEFNSLAATATATASKDRDHAPSSGYASSDSSWIPPADWEVKKRASTLDLPSRPPMPVSMGNAAPPRNHFSSPTPAPLSFRRLVSTERTDDIDSEHEKEKEIEVKTESESESEIPPPTPEKDAIFKHPSASASSSVFPPRTSSRAAAAAVTVPYFAAPTSLDNGNGHLSPIHEISEHTLASVLARHDSQNTLRYFAPSGPAAAAATATTAPATTAAPTTAAAAAAAAAAASRGTPKTTAAMVSALRNLFHKKSSELGRGDRSIRSRFKRSRGRGRAHARLDNNHTPPPATPCNHNHNHDFSFDGGSTPTPTPAPPPPTPANDEDGNRNDIRHMTSSVATPTSHLLALAVAAARDAENALAQARLAVAWCEDCVERMTGVVAELRGWSLD